MDSLTTKELVIFILGATQSIVLFVIGAYIKSLWSYLKELKDEQSNFRMQVERIFARMNMLEVAISKIEVKQTTIESALAMHLKTMESIYTTFRDEVKDQFQEFRADLKEIRQKK